MGAQIFSTVGNEAMGSTEMGGSAETGSMDAAMPTCDTARERATKGTNLKGTDKLGVIQRGGGR